MNLVFDSPKILHLYLKPRGGILFEALQGGSRKCHLN